MSFKIYLNHLFRLIIHLRMISRTDISKIIVITVAQLVHINGTESLTLATLQV